MSEPRAIDHDRRRRIRLLFLAVLLFVPAQAVFGLKVAKPYPTLTLPSFQGVPHDGDTIALTEAEVVVRFRDGGTMEVGGRRLLGDDGEMDELLARFVLANVFDPATNPSDAAPADAAAVKGEPTGGVARRLYDGLTPPWYPDGQDRASDPRTKAWLRERLAHIAPGRQPEAVAVTWFRTRYPVGGDRQPLSRERIGTVESEL